MSSCADTLRGMTSDEARAVLTQFNDELGKPAQWPAPVEFADSLALCALNSVYSLRARSAIGQKAVRNYRAFRKGAGGDADTDNATDLLAAIDAAGGPVRFASEVLGVSNVLPGTRRLKSQGLYEGASRLVAIGVNTTVDIRDASEDKLVEYGSEWMRTKGLSTASWDYVLMNAGSDGVKVDSMVKRFVARALGREPRSLKISQVKAVLAEVARELGTDRRTLDRAVWIYESERARRRR
jgi:hypothetical protein